MSAVWTAAIIIGGLFYISFIWMIILGLTRLRLKPPDHSAEQPRVSVVIPARNEETRIGATLSSILAQDYPPDRFEIIVVDDRSEDRTGEVVEAVSKRDSRVRLIRQSSVDPNLSPKKQALELGIRSADSDVIVTTDADCRYRKGWLKGLTQLLVPGVGMAVGQARFDNPSDSPLWQRLQSLDFQAQQTASAGLAAAGMPFTCSGAGLAFRMELFDEVGGWEGVKHLISGDDELLLAKAHRSRWGIAAATGPEAVVRTVPPANPLELWNQRARWGSKGLYYRPSRRLILAGIFLFYLAMTVGPVIWAAGGPGQIWLGWGILKCLLDWTVLRLGCRLFDEGFRPSEFLLLELLHPLAIVVLAVAGHIGSFEWKGQRFRSRGG